MTEKSCKNLTPEDFLKFKRQLQKHDKSSAANLVSLQKFAYVTVDTLLKRNVNAEGETLGETERGYLIRIKQEIETTLCELKEEYSDILE